MARTLVITNPPGIPTWRNKKHQSIIDLSISKINYRTTIETITENDHRALLVHTNNFVEPRTILKRPAKGSIG